MNRPPDAIAGIFRRSLAGALIAAWIAAYAAAVQAPPIEPPFEGGDDEELNRANHLAAVSQMRLRLRSMLDDREREEASVDRSALLSRKLAVDAALAPAVLLLELGGQGRLEPAAMLRVDYEYRVLEVRGPDDAVAEAVSQLGTAWHSEAVGGFGFEYRSSRNGAAEDDFPAFVHWRGMIRGESLAMRAHWFEPFLAQRRVDFPLNPEALLLEFSPEGVSIRSPFPTPADARASFPRESPRLRNPSDLYDLVDSLRVASFVLRHPAAFVPYAGHAFTLVDGRASEGDEAPQELRSISWRLRSDGVDRLDIWQPVLALRHEAAHRLVGEATVNGERVGGEARRPAASLAWMPSGLHARVSFRAPDPSLDQAGETAPIDARLRLPAEFVLSTRGEPLAGTEFGAFSFGSAAAAALGSEQSWLEIESAVRESFERRDLLATASSNVASAARAPSSAGPGGVGASVAYSAEQILDEVDPLVARARLRVNLLEAALRLDAAAHDRAISLMGTRLAQDGVEPRWMVMNAQAWIEELAGPLDRPDAALALAAPAWLALADTLEPADQLAELSRLIVSGRWELALLLSRSLRQSPLPPGGAEWLDRLERTITPWVKSLGAAPVRPGSHLVWDERISAALRQLLEATEVP